MRISHRISVLLSAASLTRKKKFTYDYFYPYLRGTGVSSYEDVSVERHADKESYAGGMR